MRRSSRLAGLLLTGWLLFASTASAMRIAPPPGPVRIINSDAVFVGRVTAMEPLNVDATVSPAAKDAMKYQIAIVQVNQIIRGLKDEKTVRVGFLVPLPPVKPKIGGPILLRPRGTPTLEVGQEGLFMISKHHEGKFYQAPDFGYFFAKNQANFDDEVKTAKKVSAIADNPLAVLRGKNAEDQLLAASVLVNKYRLNRIPGPATQQPIDAEESKLILQAIADAKWQPILFGKINPWQLFNQLGIGPQDGFQQPKNFGNIEEVHQAVQNWVRANGNTYRIKRFVPQIDKQ